MHDYKYSTAALGDAEHVSPAWRDRYLAPAVHWLCSDRKFGICPTNHRRLQAGPSRPGVREESREHTNIESEEVKAAERARALLRTTPAATHLHPSDLRGFARLATNATAGLADLVEAMHHTITRPLLGGGMPGRTRGLTGLIYQTVRGVTRLVGGGVDAILAQLRPTLVGRASSPEREAVLAALNGVLGDYLVASDNPLAIPMTLRCDGRSLVLEKDALAVSIPRAGGKLAVLIHGLCMNDLQWNREGHDHGAVLARALGYCPLYLHYNSGRHTSTNGRALADMLELLLEQWPHPVEQVVIIAHSMGGLVARSACHYGEVAGHDWIQQLRKLVFLGTPHQGAPLERGGNWVDIILGATPYAAPFARLGKIRSAGITDLRYGNVLDEHWVGRDRFARARDSRQPVPLPKRLQSYAIAATTGKKSGDIRDRLLGDGLVPVSSALGHHQNTSRALAFPKRHQWISYDMNHLDLLGSNAVSDRIVRWFASTTGARRPTHRLTRTLDA